MFKKLLFLLIVFSFAILTFALDDQGNPNDPTGNDRANACYEDGTMANKCNSEWEWICGWYMIRFDYGIFSREEIPASCATLLPTLPEEQLADSAYVYPTAGCIYFYFAYYLDFNGGNFLPGGSAVYSDAACTNLIASTAPVVYAPNGAGDAAEICIVHGYTGAGATPNSEIYECF